MEQEKLATGIDGLDEMLGGGVPKGHNVVVVGSFGTGKTSFALQFIWQGLQNDEPCIFISLEEDEESVKNTASSYGWDFAPHLENKKLALVKLVPADMKSTVSKIKGELPDFIKQFGAKRIVLDSVSLLAMLFDDEKEKREQLFNLVQLIKDCGTTSLFTAEAKDVNSPMSRDGLAEYTADGVISLSYNQPEGSSEVHLALRVVKMRRTSHSRRVKPYQITDKGIVVMTDSEVF